MPFEFNWPPPVQGIGPGLSGDVTRLGGGFPSDGFVRLQAEWNGGTTIGTPVLTYATSPTFGTTSMGFTFGTHLVSFLNRTYCELGVPLGTSVQIRVELYNHDHSLNEQQVVLGWQWDPLSGLEAYLSTQFRPASQLSLLQQIHDAVVKRFIAQ